MKESLTIFFPAYNDEGTIATMILKSAIVVKELDIKDYEIIVIDDASPDNCGKLADELAKIIKNVKIIHHETNEGYGGALKSGFSNATKDLIFYTDGDCQYDVFELKKLFPLMTKDIDMVNGYKNKRSDPWYRTILGKIYHYAVRFSFGIKIKDVDCDFRLMRKRILENITLESNSGLICVEMMKKITDKNFKIAEAGVSHHFRAYGKSQFFNFKRTAIVLLGLFFMWWKLVVKKEHHGKGRI